MTENIYQTPQAEVVLNEGGDVYGYKRYVIHEKDMEWPDRCYKCGERSEGHKKVNLYYVNPWIYLTILIMPLLTIILALIFRKRFKVELPICDVHLKRRAVMISIQWIVTLLSVGGIILSSFLSSDLLVLFSILGFTVVVIMAIAGRPVSLIKYKRGNLWVRGAGKPFINHLPQFEE